MVGWAPLRSVGCAVCVLLLVGCGSSSQGGTAVRLGHDSIASAAVARWMSALAPEHEVPDAPSFGRCVSHRESVTPGTSRSLLQEECQAEYEGLKRHALRLLITARWLLGEAREEGLTIAPGQVSRRLAEGRLPIEGGQITAADSRLAAEAEVASEAVVRRLRERQPQVTRAQIVSVYRRNIVRYEHPELREIHLSEGIPTRQFAIELRNDLIHGRRDIRNNSLQETINRRNPPQGRKHEAAMLHTIFTAKLGVFSQPQPFNQGWGFMVVFHITPRTVDPLAKVEGAIRQELEAQRMRPVLAAFVSEWAAKWRARTDCGADYTVPRCRQFKGAGESSTSLALS